MDINKETRASQPSSEHHQAPLAVIGMACRLPGSCNTLKAFWDFLEDGGIASRTPPETRFSFDTHNDDSKRIHTMASPGGMFIDADPRDLDASFFRLTKSEAIAMDPQQRQLLEVVYEGLENCGITMEEVSDRNFGCFVGSYACDYGDMDRRDPEDRAHYTTLGTGRAMLSNRISHFLNIKGPSITIDTACSGSLVGIDLANRYLQTREIEGAIVAGCNIYLSPEHVMDGLSSSGTASLSGLCHTFDAKADGYIKAEGVNMVILKRLDDAIRDGNPIRGIIRGTATGSDGFTPGIASPNSAAQAATIRQAYANAGIDDLSATSYVECHGTGTRAGDRIELDGVASVFSSSRSEDNPLAVGSVKSNIGHSEPAAGISGLLKVLLSMEKGVIPGNPTFETPNPQIDFQRLKVRASKRAIPWTVSPEKRRASINSFGFGGSNAHVVVESGAGLSSHVSSYSSALFPEEKTFDRPYVLAFSANDETSLTGSLNALDRHLTYPGVDIDIRDLAYTLSEKRTRHFHRGFINARGTEIDVGAMTHGKTTQPPRIGLVFTGQGAQWPQMGRDLVSAFPVAKRTILQLDQVLKRLPDGPDWSLLDELIQPRTPEHYRKPELSQPLVTALQLALLAVLKDCKVEYATSVGHSSGEIAAAVAADLLTPEQAIKIAYYRGKAIESFSPETPLGMMAVGLGKEGVSAYLEPKGVQIACVNSPESVTLSGVLDDLLRLEEDIKKDGHFARILQVDTAYHSRHIASAALQYRLFLEANCGSLDSKGSNDVTMYSSVSSEKLCELVGVSYWETNMVSPVQFDGAMKEMMKESLDMLIEIGPSNALSGPINQIKKSLNSTIEYVSAWKRGDEALTNFCNLAGKLFIRGAPISLSRFNSDSSGHTPSLIVDLPNYQWNHSTKYWHESRASKDWRFRKFPHHDLLGSKILGTLWHRPTWRKKLRAWDIPWLQDHRLGKVVVFPAAGYIAMVMEAAFQMQKAVGNLPQSLSVEQGIYHLRNCRFLKALVFVDGDAEQEVLLTLTPKTGPGEGWLEFTVATSVDEMLNVHSTGLVRVNGDVNAEWQKAPESDSGPLIHATSTDLWYKAMREVGYNFGESFEKSIQVESVMGSRRSRSLLSFMDFTTIQRQSTYPLHPTSIDACFQAVAGSIWAGDRTAVNARLVPKMIDSLMIRAQTPKVEAALAVATSKWTGIGREENPESYTSDVCAYDWDTKNLVYEMRGLQYQSLEAERSNLRPHVYTRSCWIPDITTLTAPQLGSLINDVTEGNKIGVLLNIIAFKNPEVSVLEISSLASGESLWIDDDPSTSLFDRGANSRLHLVVPSQAALSAATRKYQRLRYVSVHLMQDLDSLRETKFDVLLMQDMPSSKIGDLMQTVEKPCFLIATETVKVSEPDGPVQTNGATHDSSKNKNGDSHLCLPDLERAGFSQLLRIQDVSVAFVFGTTTNSSESETNARTHEIDVLSLSNRFNAEIDDLVSAVSVFGWTCRRSYIRSFGIKADQTIMILDDLFGQTLLDITRECWNSLRAILSQHCRVLWVTTGAQKSVSNPDGGLVQGFLRSIRNENPDAMIMSLDVESSSGPDTTKAISNALSILSQMTDLSHSDAEIVERGGLLYIERILPDTPTNDLDTATTKPSLLQSHTLPLFEHESCVRLESSQVGSLDHLEYVVVHGGDVPVPDGYIEVAIEAVSLNFKDVAVVIGLVPGDERLLGLDGAGMIRAVGKDAGDYRVGQRVLANKKGSLANRVRCKVDGEVFPLPDWVSFEEACTLNTVYSTALYALADLALATKGKTVLIHSAAGGLGLAAVQLCKYLGLEIYATIGNEEKRDFLIEKYELNSDRIFSSRNASFAQAVMAATGQKGIDIILNTLTGELLDASWQCIAEGGVFVELGKKDILDRAELSMEPLNRNASFRAADLSRDSITPSLKFALLAELFELLRAGQIKPVISKTFGFEDAAAAFKLLATGKSIGKIVISRQGREALVPIRPMAPTISFNPHGSYLIVGGLKGIGGSMALYLARQGVRSLVVLSRSGYKDNTSLKVSSDLRSLGVELNLIVGDVTKIGDVYRAFESTRKPICGIIQGAMVLRDKTYTSMTHNEFHAALLPKTRGSWNLHLTALKKGANLEFFTLLSSICGVVGQKGQANYSAANSFLDAFALYRKSLGLPACAVDLGVVEDVGYVNNRETLSRRLLLQAWTPITEAMLNRILFLSILQQQTTPANGFNQAQLITGIPAPLPVESPAHRDVRFAILRQTTSGVGRRTDLNEISSIRAALKSPSTFSGSQEELLYTLVDQATECFNRSLGLEEPLDAERPMASYGVDSLVAIEFRNWVRMELGIEISTLEVVGARTVVSLCRMIMKRGAVENGTI